MSATPRHLHGELQFFLCCAAIFACSGSVIISGPSYKNPNHLPVPNLYTALRGYDIYEAEPFTPNFIYNSGFKAIIFEPLVSDEHQRFSLHPGIDATDLGNCDVVYFERAVSSITQLRTEQLRTTMVGSSWKVGPEMKVSGGVSGGGAHATVERRIDAIAQSGKSSSRENRVLRNFFLGEKGAMVVLQAHCAHIHVRLIEYKLPKFREGFSQAVKELYWAKDHQRKAMFKRFTEVFGTHYMAQSFLGRKLLYTRYYTHAESSRVDEKTLIWCAKKQSKLSAFSTSEYERKGAVCLNGNFNQSSMHSNYLKRERLSSWGATPNRNIDEWLKQEIETPVPIRMEPVPILSLFRPDLLARIDSGINATKFRSWIEPFYVNISDIMGYQKSENRCNVDDTCKFGETCVDGQDGAFTCEKEPVALRFKRNDSGYGYTHIQYSLDGRQQHHQFISQCDAGRFCSINITGSEKTVHHIYPNTEMFSAYDGGSDSTNDWTRPAGAIEFSVLITFRRIAGCDGYFVTIIMNHSKQSFVYYEKQCSHSHTIEEDTTYCSTAFPATGLVRGSYDIFVLADLPFSNNPNPFVVQRIIF